MIKWHRARCFNRSSGVIFISFLDHQARPWNEENDFSDTYSWYTGSFKFLYTQVQHTTLKS